jgi:hypothetical protein
MGVNRASMVLLRSYHCEYGGGFFAMERKGWETAEKRAVRVTSNTPFLSFAPCLLGVIFPDDSALLSGFAHPSPWGIFHSICSFVRSHLRRGQATRRDKGRILTRKVHVRGICR